ncbi:MAG: thiol peroxidase [Thermodesulfobacteriota bacterium]
MSERKGAVTMHGNPLTLVGSEVQVGQLAPEVTLLNNDLALVKISDYKGKVLVISAVPSLDTPTCDLETRRFNSEAAGLGDQVVIVTVSMDLPFAQKRWCGAAGVERVITLSDHRQAAFGQAYGLLIKELRLLARCVLVLDREQKIRYIQLVKELSKEPDYAAVLAAVKKLI